MPNLTPQQCPRYDSCSAPICPLDPHALKRRMLRDERVCHYIRKFSQKLHDDSVDTKIAEAISELMVHASLNAALNRALKKLDNSTEYAGRRP